MKTFNKREKAILDMLVNISNESPEFFSFHLQNSYFRNLTASALFVLPQTKQIILYIPKIDFQDPNKRKKIMIEFLEFLSLIKFLKNERFIDVIQLADITQPLYIMGKGFDKAQEDPVSKFIILNDQGDHIDPNQFQLIMDSNSDVIFEGSGLTNEIYQQIIENCMGLLFVSEDLKEFVKNKYKSKEDLRYKYGQIATWTGIGLALVFGILGLYNPFEDKEPNPLIKNTNEIHQDIHMMMEKFKSHQDSLKKNTKHIKNS